VLTLATILLLVPWRALRSPLLIVALQDAPSDRGRRRCISFEKGGNEKAEIKRGAHG
jgi:hypothetical protein